MFVSFRKSPSPKEKQKGNLVFAQEEFSAPSFSEIANVVQ
jgi:hypothetical protein